MGDEKEGGNVTRGFTAYSELQHQLLSKWPVTGIEPTTLGTSACESSVTLASLGKQ